MSRSMLAALLDILRSWSPAFAQSRSSNRAIDGMGEFMRQSCRDYDTTSVGSCVRFGTVNRPWRKGGNCPGNAEAAECGRA